MARLDTQITARVTSAGKQHFCNTKRRVLASQMPRQAISFAGFRVPLGPPCSDSIMDEAVRWLHMRETVATLTVA